MNEREKERKREREKKVERNVERTRYRERRQKYTNLKPRGCRAIIKVITGHRFLNRQPCKEADTSWNCLITTRGIFRNNGLEQ